MLCKLIINFYLKFYNSCSTFLIIRDSSESNPPLFYCDVWGRFRADSILKSGNSATPTGVAALPLLPLNSHFSLWSPLFDSPPHMSQYKSGGLFEWWREERIRGFFIFINCHGYKNDEIVCVLKLELYNNRDTIVISLTMFTYFQKLINVFQFWSSEYGNILQNIWP